MGGLVMQGVEFERSRQRRVASLRYNLPGLGLSLRSSPEISIFYSSSMVSYDFGRHIANIRSNSSIQASVILRPNHLHRELLLLDLLVLACSPWRVLQNHISPRDGSSLSVRWLPPWSWNRSRQEQ